MLQINIQQKKKKKSYKDKNRNDRFEKIKSRTNFFAGLVLKRFISAK